VRRAETRLGPVGEFEFLKWTADKHLRHSKFVGLRGDKNAKAIGSGMTLLSNVVPLQASIAGVPEIVLIDRSR
jgi:hypothetical protein